MNLFLFFCLVNRRVSKVDLFTVYSNNTLVIVLIRTHSQSAESLRDFLQLQIDEKLAPHFDLSDLFMLLDDSRYTEVVLDKIPLFVKGSSGFRFRRE